ncbi:small integral membrane protein 1 [Hoplias malabaricus]|uniref:small integral membrane protein 1 n=1 Tax=Hoplias malabaricus TaxID=27720 RepID=UPI0034626AC2
MESGEVNIQYNRWNDKVTHSVAASETSMNGVYNRLCTGQLGGVVKVAGSLAVIASMYIVGYLTGYYVHKC